MDQDSLDMFPCFAMNDCADLGSCDAKQFSNLAVRPSAKRVKPSYDPHLHLVQLGHSVTLSGTPQMRSTASLDGVFCVVLRGPGVEVLGVDTAWIVAVVTDIEPFGNRTVENPMAFSMSITVRSIPPKGSVSRTDLAARPLPAPPGNDLYRAKKTAAGRAKSLMVVIAKEAPRALAAVAFLLWCPGWHGGSV